MAAPMLAYQSACGCVELPETDDLSPPLAQSRRDARTVPFRHRGVNRRGACPWLGRPVNSVDGNDQLYDSATQSVTVFADWTGAEWLGWGDLPAEPEVCALGVDIPTCVQPRSLTLQVGADTVTIDVSLLWQAIPSSLVGNAYEPTLVEVKIAAHPSGTLVLQIRDADTALPVLMVARSLPETAASNDTWDFEPFAISRGDTFCRTEPDACNVSLSAGDLAITAGDQSWDVAAMEIANIDAAGIPYSVLHRYLFEPERMGPSDCDLPEVLHKSFAIVQRAGQ